MNATVFQIHQITKLTTPVEKKTRTTVDTIMVTPAVIAKWKLPPFQREVKENKSVLGLVEELKANGGVWPGIITLGMLHGQLYRVDCQHRIKAFEITGLPEGYTDVRIVHVETMADMGKEFVRLNSQLARMRPDDILRGMEQSVPALQAIRSGCPFVGYDQVRRGSASPVVSMSMLLRTWRGSGSNVPSTSAGLPSSTLAETITNDETQQLIQFMTEAHGAFGREPQYARLWGSLNLILCMWLYRKTVVIQYSPRCPKLNKELFRKCLMSLSADSDYLDWLVGRAITDRDRSPAYSRVKRTFAARLKIELERAVALPDPDWAHN